MPRVAADQYVPKVRMPDDIDLFWGKIWQKPRRFRWSRR